MAQELLKRTPRKGALGRAISMKPPQEKGALVGNYKVRQLERWPGHYNYPRFEDGFLAAENAKSAKTGRAVAPLGGFVRSGCETFECLGCQHCTVPKMDEVFVPSFMQMIFQHPQQEST